MPHTGKEILQVVKHYGAISSIKKLEMNFFEMQNLNGYYFFHQQ